MGWVYFGSLQEYHPVLKLSAGKLTITSLVFIILLQWAITLLAALITEELAFRGYLISRFHFMTPCKAVMISAIMFGLWHAPIALLLIKGGWLRGIIYIVNISLLGIVFGWLFIRSKSLIPPSIAHGLWNALEYTFWGMGNEQGLLLGSHRVLFDPEEGVAGTLILLVMGARLLIQLKKTAGGSAAK
ncbi:MAG TPA: CPBP family intramembrane metalloprotease [bacterium]|nr:CPBP family intramembrane metalloprotease [bacterium]